MFFRLNDLHALAAAATDDDRPANLSRLHGQCAVVLVVPVVSRKDRYTGLALRARAPA